MRIVDEFDHFVLPVDDLVAAEEFYPRVFGGEIVRRNGLNVRDKQLGRIPHTFVDVAGKRLGVYLQSEERPASAALRGSPTYSFETTEQGLAETVEELARSNVPWEGPLDEDRPFAARSVYLNDPAGNHFHVYVPNQARSAQADGASRMTAVGYLELEAPDLEASVRFYEQALGLELLSYGQDDSRGLRQATMRLPSGQILLLTETEFSDKGLVMGRTVLGPHLGFLVPGARWTEALANLDALGIPNADRGVEGKARAAGEVGTYMDDPAGNVVQFITDGAPIS
jgi:catechol-2,3-dioxygenase